jgi:signal transduction histidine kinase
LKIIIKDDGRGFDLNLKTAGNGTLSLKNRAKEIKGELKIISKISDGTTLTLNVKLP